MPRVPGGLATALGTAAAIGIGKSTIVGLPHAVRHATARHSTPPAEGTLKEHVLAPIPKMHPVVAGALGATGAVGGEVVAHRLLGRSALGLRHHGPLTRPQLAGAAALGGIGIGSWQTLMQRRRERRIALGKPVVTGGGHRTQPREDALGTRRRKRRAATALATIGHGLSTVGAGAGQLAVAGIEEGVHLGELALQGTANRVTRPLIGPIFRRKHPRSDAGHGCAQNRGTPMGGYAVGRRRGAPRDQALAARERARLARVISDQQPPNTVTRPEAKVIGSRSRAQRAPMPVYGRPVQARQDSAIGPGTGHGSAFGAGFVAATLLPFLLRRRRNGREREPVDAYAHAGSIPVQLDPESLHRLRTLHGAPNSAQLRAYGQSMGEW